MQLEQQKKPRKALCLLSGGLDSLLAAKLILNQGIHVEGINFFTGFCIDGRPHSPEVVRSNRALVSADQLGIKLHIIDVAKEYKAVVSSPKYGYGANLNPCLDCKIFMIKKAKQWAWTHGFDFIITGEVMEQRPKSQNKRALSVVVDESEMGGRLLRPLSAKILPLTVPEERVWVKRSGLLGLTGRSRKPQLALAAKLGLGTFPSRLVGVVF